MTLTSEFKLIPLGEIHESTHNPRRHFDGPGLEQLADSIRKVGILTPALVRPNAKGFELASGHRRYRAAKLAGLTQLPCIVRPMTDQEFMEALTIENLQREDVHPLDEAKGYEALMAAPYKMDPEKIAERVGKSVKYIYDRVKLLALSKDAQQLFWDGKIEAGHAILLARLPQADQARVIGDMPADYRNGGLFRVEHLLYYDEEAQGEGNNPPIKAVSVRELADYIKRHIRFNAKQADGFLFPDTVSKLHEAVQAKTKIVEITHDFLANEDVRRASNERVYGERAWKRADGKEGSKICARSVMGVVAAGAGQGDAFLVCTNKDRCEVHWGSEIRAKQKNAKLTPNSPAAEAMEEKAAKGRRAEQERYAQQEERRERWKKMSPKIEAAVLDRVKGLPATGNGILSEILIKAVTGSGRMHVAGKNHAKTAEDLIRYLAGLALVIDIRSYWSAADEFPKTARALGVDLSPFLKPEKDKPAKTQPVQTSARKPVKTRKKA